MLQFLGANSPWLTHFDSLFGNRKTSDKQGDLDQTALALAHSIQTLDGADDKILATTLLSAVAARNLVSHRHTFLSRDATMTLGGVCANSVVFVWLLAKDREASSDPARRRLGYTVPSTYGGGCHSRPACLTPPEPLATEG